jgi:hypothetical protein
MESTGRGMLSLTLPEHIRPEIFTLMIDFLYTDTADLECVGAQKRYDILEIHSFLT